MERTGLVDRIEAVGSRAVFEVVITYLVLQVAGEVLVDKARYVVGWTRYLVAATPRGR